MAMLHRTVRRAIDKDPAAAEGLLTQLGRPPERAGDDRLAIILIAIGIAMAGASVIAVDDPGIVRAGIAAALFPLLVGGALWLRLYMLKRSHHRDAGK
jgi:membrane associated rhomboid family serine protease